MKTLRSIFSFLLALLFLVSVTGFSYTKHICLDSGKVHIALDADYDCSDNDPENCCQAITSCSTEHDACCVNTTTYLKTTEDFTTPEKTELPITVIQHSLAYQSLDLYPEYTPPAEKRAHAPPGVNSSGEILLRHGILLI